MSRRIFLHLPSFPNILCFSRVLAGTSWHNTFKSFINYYIVNKQYFNSFAVCLQKTIERTPLNGAC